ncbi:MAG: DUF1835 domain-containing protein [Lentisphaerae bacterium]|nr:DUF1835 domain-containing protein [Lentisphaerota bacterium]
MSQAGTTMLHITSGDIAGDRLARAGLPGEVRVWHDILYDGPRNPGWPDDDTLEARAAFLEEATGGGLTRERVRGVLQEQYRRLSDAASGAGMVLWFDACLFDQAMLAHVLTCLRIRGARDVELICVDAFPGIDPYHGLGQLRPDQLASRYGDRRPVTGSQYEFAVRVDRALAVQDAGELEALSRLSCAPLPWIPAAIGRWLQERPDAVTGLGRLESLALAAIRGGCESPVKILASVAAAETPPQFWGESMLWAKINGLADRDPPLVKIGGPGDRLPQWESDVPLEAFCIHAQPAPRGGQGGTM